jgi:hypothetical protein
MVIVPGEDRFLPFTLTIRAGESVEWVNNDTDDHTVVSNDAFNTAGHQGLNVILPGTDSNGGQPGTLTLHFTHPGTFAYYCRFHSHLDEDNQPVAPGPDGGIQDPNSNFGTPMMGEITFCRAAHRRPDRRIVRPIRPTSVMAPGGRARFSVDDRRPREVVVHAGA